MATSGLLRFRAAFLGAFLFATAFANAQTDRIHLTLDTSEAEAVLAILDKQAAKQTAAEADWQRLFSSEPYTRLKKREASLKRTLTDDDFKKFVSSSELTARRDELKRTLATWKQADLHSSAQRVLSYLPQDALIKAKIYPVIKPKTNSFVFETKTDPTIFLYLDPAISPAKFENTVAHELHHIGLSSFESQTEDIVRSLPENVRKTVDWMSAFGEGEAMLAAAGGPDVDPQGTSTPEDHARWQKDMTHFNPDLLEVQKFFDNVIAGNFHSPDELQEAAFKFFGVQGPWYTVGYRMAVMVEKRYGRAALIDCMIDPRNLLRRYNMAARAWNQSHPNEKLELWSADLLTKVSAPPLPDEPAPD